MTPTLLIHIAACAVALVFGYVALFAAKGGSVHRRAGMVFVYTMVIGAMGGLVVSVLQDVAPAINIPAALLTSALIITSLTTVRRQSALTSRVDLAATIVLAGVCLSSLTFGVEAVANGGTRAGMPAFPFFMFGVVSLIAVVGEVRVRRGGTLRGGRRLARHLWRMTFALFIAALSFFIGQAKVIPEAVRIPPLLALPVVAVLLSMLYWLWRVRSRRPLVGVAGVVARETA